MAMNCEAFSENIDAYIDGGLESAIRAEMERHAEECVPCMRLLKEAKALREMLAEMSEVHVPLSAQAAWRKAVREEAKAKRKPASLWGRGFAAAAAVLVVLAAGTMGMRMSDTLPAADDLPAITLANEQDSEPFDLFRLENGMPKKNDMIGMGPGSYDASSLQADGSAENTRSLSSETQSSQRRPVIVRTAERMIESKSYDTDIQWLDDLVIEYGAYFEERSEMAAIDGSGAGRVSTVEIRVPSERLDDFLMELDQLGRTVSRDERAEDVTGRYVDTQSRKEALELQKEKLTEMLAATKDIEELIAIDDKLTEVISSLEELEGSMRRWTSEQNYSQVELVITEALEAIPEPVLTTGERMKQGFEESLIWLHEFGQDALVMLATYGPRLIIVLPVIALAIVGVWLIRKKKN